MMLLAGDDHLYIVWSTALEYNDVDDAIHGWHLSMLSLAHHRCRRRLI